MLLYFGPFINPCKNAITRKEICKSGVNAHIQKSVIPLKINYFLKGTTLHDIKHSLLAAKMMSIIQKLSLVLAN